MPPNRPRSFLSQLVLMVNVLILLLTFSPCISSSPAASFNPNNQEENKLNDDKMIDPVNGLLFEATSSNDDASPRSFSSSVHQEPLLQSSISTWYGQPRTSANQFLLSEVNDNDLIVPKWFTRFNKNYFDDDLDMDDDSSLKTLHNKRSAFFRSGGILNLKKRKQTQKLAMEVMNEIVNSIYLKR